MKKILGLVLSFLVPTIGLCVPRGGSNLPNGTPLVLAYSGNALTIGTEGPQNLKLMTNNTVRAEINGSTGVLSGLSGAALSSTLALGSSSTFQILTGLSGTSYLQMLHGEALDSDVTTTSSVGNTLAYIASDTTGNQFAFVADQADTTGSQINAFKTRSTSLDANTVIGSADDIFKIVAFGSDGASYQVASLIKFGVDGTPGSGDMPGNIIFQTTPDGSSTPAQVLKLGNDKIATFADKITSTRTTDLGWTPVAGANTACNTTCTSACVFGIDTGSTTNSLLACTDATADICLCAGAS